METEAALKRSRNYLRSNYSLTITPNVLTIDDFSTIRKGDGFSVRTCWRTEIQKIPVYFISYYNSYRLSATTAGKYYQPRYTSSLYFGAYIPQVNNIPDTIIQPLTLTERVADLFLHENIKVDNKVFDKHYLLQSLNKEQILKKLNNSFFDAVGSVEDVHIEIRDAKCFLFFLRPVKDDDGYSLAMLAENIINI